MDWHAVISWGERVVGVSLTLLVLVDIFMTVLYARIGSGLLCRALAYGLWRSARAVATATRRRGDFLLSLVGPSILVATVCTWVVLLMVGIGLFLHPALGHAITATTGETPTDLGTALYVAGDSMTTVGTSDVAPRTTFYRLCYTFTSVIGLSVITLTLTYFLEIYNALQHRNTFALKLHLATGETGDAAEFIAGLGAEGKFDNGYGQLTEIAAEMAHLRESHHFYPVLFYFRFGETYYALSRAALTMLDAVTLIKSGLDDKRYAWLKESVAVTQVWRGNVRTLDMLAQAFVPATWQLAARPPDEQTRARWRERYFAALRRLRQAGIQTAADEAAGADLYVKLRGGWSHYIVMFAHYLCHTVAEIDPEGTVPDRSDERKHFKARLHSPGA
jgi:hypothetical protein